MAPAKQLAFTSIVEAAFRARQRRIGKYIDANKDAYRGMAALITPDRNDDDAVWCRAAFAILSANAPFADAVAALDYARAHKGACDGVYMARWKQTPVKAEWLNASVVIPREAWLRADQETWNTYRLRLARDVKGLGVAKASFTACLLYPLDADLACVDTHMQRVYLGHASFKKISLSTYMSVESAVRKVAHRHGINTFLAQWLIWDCARGKIENHNIFPGSHKTDEPLWITEGLT